MRKHFFLLMLMALLPLAGWAQDISEFGVKIQGYGAFEFNGAPQAVTLKVQMDEATEPLPAEAYEVVYYNEAGTTKLDGAPTNAGTYKVSAKGVAPYSGETGKINYTIQRKSINSDAFIAGTTPTVASAEFKYDGEAKTFEAVTLGWNTDADEEIEVNLTAETDFTIAYDKNVNAGDNTAELLITGVGNYKDTKKVNFSIAAGQLPAEAAKYTFTALATDPTYSGADVTTLPTFAIDGLTLGTDYTIEWHKLANCEDEAVTPKGAGDYYLLAKGINNYAGTKKDATWKFNVKQKNLIVYVQNMEKTYDGANVPFIDATNNIKNAVIVLNGLEGEDAATAARAALEAKVVAQFKVEGAKKDAGTYVMKPVITAAGAFANYKTEGNLLETGIYTIKKRSVTVTPLNQKFTYTGEAQNITTDKIVSPAEGATVSIEALNAEAGTGLVGEENIASLYNIVKKEGVTIKEKTNAAYTGAIEIVATEAAEASNYTIVPGPAANVEMDGADIILIAGTLSKPYGYTINDDDFFVVNNQSLPASRFANASFKVTQGETEFTAADGILPVGTYTIEILNAEEIIPENFVYKAANIYKGELTITKKPLTININQVSLNVGATVEDLNRYATVADYSAGLVAASATADKAAIDEEIVYAFAGGIGEALAATYSGDENFNAETSIYTGGVVAAAIENDKYDITIVPGNIKIGAAGSLVLDPTDSQLALKIGDAANTEAPATFDVSFANLTMKANEWYAMVLPFDIDPLEMVNEFDRYVIFNELNTDMTTDQEIKFTLTMDPIVAGTPFLIKFAPKSTDVATTVVDWSAAGIAFADKDINAKITPVANDYIAFKGTYASNEILGVEGKPSAETANIVENCWWLGNSAAGKKNTWLKPKNNYHALKPMEAYLIAGDKWGTYAPIITVEDFDGQTTAIKSLSVDQINNLKTDGLYNLQGVKMQNVPTQKGVYIQNGKKVVIK